MPGWTPSLRMTTTTPLRMILSICISPLNTSRQIPILASAMFPLPPRSWQSTPKVPRSIAIRRDCPVNRYQVSAVRYPVLVSFQVARVLPHHLRVSLFSCSCLLPPLQSHHYHQPPSRLTLIPLLLSAIRYQLQSQPPSSIFPLPRPTLQDHPFCIAIIVLSIATSPLRIANDSPYLA